MKLTVLLLSASLLLSAAENKTSYKKQSAANGHPSSTLLNINRISAWYQSSGEQERDPLTRRAGVTYPRGAATAMYASGMVWGGMVRDGGSPVLRVNGQTYLTGTVSGKILGMRTGQIESQTDSTVRIWRIRRNYVTADLQQDASEYFAKAPALTDSNDINLLRAQYRKDWAEWPAQKGAPFYDSDGDGIFTPKFEINNGVEVPVLYPKADEPGLEGADQVIWYVINDIGASSSPWLAPPVGLEEQRTFWAYDRPSNDALGNAIFKRHTFIYKGTASTPANATIDPFYIGNWSDPDLGDPADDLIGCDSLLSFGFAYNSTSRDSQYSKFGLAPPAIGYIVLQGPTVCGEYSDKGIKGFTLTKGIKNLPMTSFVQDKPVPVDPFFPIPLNSNWHMYNMLRGLPDILPFVPGGNPPLETNPVTGQPTLFWFNGDPSTSAGWLDGVPDPAGDRRMLLSSGPITMALGDTQEVIYALVGGTGTDRIASYQVMKFNMQKVREAFLDGMIEDATGVKAEPGSSPVEFLLSQNYPNPFNPSTVINYQIPKTSMVSLMVYDILGKEAAVLVHGVQAAGNYSAEFQASNHGLTSGVYFYQLRAGDFVQTKKMVLLK